jgi:hypothetical protein
MASIVPAPHEGNSPDSQRSLRIACAWCKAEIAPGSDPVSHGICTDCSSKARNGSSPTATRLFFTGKIGDPAEDARVEAFRREDGTVGVVHVYARTGDTWLVMSDADRASILDQARTAYKVDDAEEAAIADGRRVGRL